MIIETNYETGLNRGNYLDILTPSPFSIQVTYNENGVERTDKFEGTVLITTGIIKGTIVVKCKFTINRINDIDYLIELKEVQDIKCFLLKEFNFQESYDKLKAKNNLCVESTILNKHIYNTLYTSEALKNVQIFNILSHYGDIIEYVLEKKYSENANIRDICTNQVDRNYLLKNVMKRINTRFSDHFLIKNSNNNFKLIKDINTEQGKNYRIIFDTGNAFMSIIGIDLVRELNLQQKHMFLSTYTGATGNSSTNNTYVDVEIKLDPRYTNISSYPDKIYKFKAIVNMNSLKENLLLGQSAKGLKLFFDDSYCIGFDLLRQETENYMSTDMQSLTKFLNTLFNLMCIFVTLILTGKYEIPETEKFLMKTEILNAFVKQIVLKIFKEAETYNDKPLNVINPNSSITDIIKLLPPFEETILQEKTKFSFNINTDNKEHILNLEPGFYARFLIPYEDNAREIKRDYTSDINRLLDHSNKFVINTIVSTKGPPLFIEANDSINLNTNGFYVLILRIISINNILKKIKFKKTNSLLIADLPDFMINIFKNLERMVKK